MPAKSGILLDAFNLPPAEAIAYLKAKGYAVSWNWYDTWKEAHAKAFTVAKAMSLDVLQTIRDEVTTAIEGDWVEVADGKGGTTRIKRTLTLQEFEKRLTPRLKALGWWGITEDEQGRQVQLGSPWRLRTIYRTNIQTAYMAGRYKQQRAVAADLPYWQYIAVIDAHTTDRCRSLHLKVFRADDPFWDKFYPPNHWGCRARVRALSQRALERQGVTVEDSKGKMVTKEITIGGKDDARTVTVSGYRTTRGDGVPVTYWADPGWDYNPGKAAFDWQSSALERVAPDLAGQYVSAAMPGPAFKAFFDEAAERAPEERFPVGVIDDALRAAVGAKTNVVHLSAGSLAKNKQRHPELTMAEYLLLPSVFDAPSLVVQDGPQTLVFIKKADRYYYAVMKATASGQALFNTSFRRTSLDDLKRAKAKGKVLRDEL